MATFYSDRAIVQENQMLGAMARTIPAQSVASPPGNPYPGIANATQYNLRTLGLWTTTPGLTLPPPPTNSNPGVGGSFINPYIFNNPGR